MATQSTDDVILHLDNDETAYNVMLDLVEKAGREAPTDPRVKDGIWTVEEARRFLLQDSIRDYVEDATQDAMGLVESDSDFGRLLAQELFQTAWQAIDWTAVSDHVSQNAAECKS